MVPALEGPNPHGVNPSADGLGGLVEFAIRRFHLRLLTFGPYRGLPWFHR
jgi:hypothetical protein